jgi:hypothetical protein
MLKASQRGANYTRHRTHTPIYLRCLKPFLAGVLAGIVLIGPALIVVLLKS